MKRLFLTGYLLLYFAVCHAQTIRLTDTQNSVPVLENSMVLLEKTGQTVTIDSLLKHPETYQFVPPEGTPTNAITTHDRWFRFVVQSATQTPFYLVSQLPLPSPVTLYVVEGNHLLSNHTLGPLTAMASPTSQQRRSRILPLRLRPAHRYTLYWHAATLLQPVKIIPSEQLTLLFHDEDLFVGFYFGFVVIIILYNLLLFVRLRDPDHLIYSAWVGLIALLYGQQYGYLREWMPHYFTLFQTYLVSISALTAAAHVLFGISFLQIKQRAKTLFRVGRVLVGLFLIEAIVNLFFPAQDNGLFLVHGFTDALLDLLFSLTAGIWVIRQGFKPAWYFIGGILLIWVGVGFTMGIPPNTFWVAYSLLIASIAEITLFTLALSYKVNLLKKQREDAVYQQLQLTKENQQLVETQNRLLEEKVEQRTAELRASQAQLIQKEKLASLGELTAGIAHEIQNPLNFVNNFSEVSAELVDEQKEALSKGDLGEVGFIADDLRQNLQKIAHHGRRASAIVNGMLDHSKGGTGEKQETDLVRLTQDCFNITYQGYRSKHEEFRCELATSFQPDILPVQVVPQDIGRVVVNLLSNAFYTVSERSKQAVDGYQPQIGLSIAQRNGHAELRIQDNGLGIPESIRAKIFQPFFTTKPTGQGTGLGLSLSYDIVKAHGGTLEVASQEGQGSEFIIQLPVH